MSRSSWRTLGRLIPTILLAVSLTHAQDIITTVAGSSWVFRDNGKAATAAALGWVKKLAVSPNGDLYTADMTNNLVVKVSKDGILTVVAGNGFATFSGDGGPAVKASLNGPEGVALDSAGNLYIADTGNQRIRKVNTSGIISTVAGIGGQGLSGDGGPATAAQLTDPTAVTVDAAGNLYIADWYNHRIRKVDAAGIITTVAGKKAALKNGALWGRVPTEPRPSGSGGRDGLPNRTETERASGSTGGAGTKDSARSTRLAPAGSPRKQSGM